MNIKLIKTEKDYDLALKRLDEIFDVSPGSPDEDESELLSILIEKFEDEHYPIETADPIEAIKFRMEQMGLRKTELTDILGYKSRVSEILSKKRKLSLKMIRNLHDKLKIPYEALMSDY